MKQEGENGRNLFPLLMDVEGEKVVVIGGGSVAERKVLSLIECGASVTVIAPTLTGGLSRLAENRSINYIARLYREGDLDGAALAFTAIDDIDVSTEVAEEAGRLNVPVNVVDRPDLCTFIVPSVIRRGRLTVAVSTGGASPAWARYIKDRLSGEFGEEYARLLDALAVVRRHCMQEIDDPVRRREALQKLADDTLLELARREGKEELQAELLDRVSKWSEDAGADLSE